MSHRWHEMRWHSRALWYSGSVIGRDLTTFCLGVRGGIADAAQVKRPGQSGDGRGHQHHGRARPPRSSPTPRTTLATGQICGPSVAVPRPKNSSRASAAGQWQGVIAQETNLARSGQSTRSRPGRRSPFNVKRPPVWWPLPLPLAGQREQMAVGLQGCTDFGHCRQAYFKLPPHFIVGSKATVTLSRPGSQANTEPSASRTSRVPKTPPGASNDHTSTPEDTCNLHLTLSASGGQAVSLSRPNAMSTIKSS